MHCENARPLLPLHTYGDLTDSERTAVEEHLTLCAACRLELSEFQALRENLNAQSLAVQTVDLARIYQPQTRRLQRQAWRWRLAALAGVAVALFVLFTRLEIQANAGQLVVRWGKPEPVAAVDKPVIVTAPTPKRVEPSREMLERLQVMNDLIHALADSIETGDRQRREDLQRLQMEISVLHRQSQQHFEENQHDVDALYAAQFGARTEGAKP